MAYFIFKSSDTVTPFAIINEETMDNTSSSIAFVGKRRQDYGESQQQNQLWQLENFASPISPNNPIIGQLWYDTAVNYLKIFDGIQFVRVSNSVVSMTPPLNQTDGQFWFDTTAQTLKLWNGFRWVLIGPSDDAIVYSIVFGG